MDLMNNTFIPLLPALDQLISIHPLQLQFLSKLNTPISCSFQLSNKSDQHVAFRLMVKTTNLRKYTVRPTKGIALPHSQTNVTVTIRALKEKPSVLRSNDKILVQNVAVPSTVTLKDITPEMFNKEAGKHVEECKLSADYDIPAESEEEKSENATAANDLISTLTKEKQSLIQENNRLLQILNEVATLAKEKQSIIEENIRLEQEMKLLKRGLERNNDVRVLSIFYVLVIAVLGILQWHRILIP